ncbi:hypothetical protein C8R45DRAFT_960594 [Mycena sanguinolenta]|nr:hypothetical protein C8R45DRAFT_960594 [Mycena sanguinolenta]
MSGFGNTLYRTWNPRVHADFEDMLDDCIEDNPALKRNFPAPRSAFAAATINFGPATVTNRHVDAHNLAWGWCCITALGDFDADRGGHLILWDLKLVIRFPAGSTILIPSAILRHSNVPIVAGQRRYSFTQYSAAGLFRWVDNGFRSDRSIKEDPVMQADKAYLASRTAARRTRWQTGINKYLRWNGA